VKFITKYPTNIPTDRIKIIALNLTIVNTEMIRNIEATAAQFDVYRKGV